ncbi:hypothetical protein JW898_00275 [Candidatus Woesearchaeota archaeon]|nr:hypothetical protein [Candidatus Woesearchaeota archaeon]
MLMTRERVRPDRIGMVDLRWRIKRMLWQYNLRCALRDITASRGHERRSDKCRLRVRVIRVIGRKLINVK